MIVIVGAEIVGGVVIVEETPPKLPISNCTGTPAATSTVSKTRLAVDNVDSDSC